MCEPRWFVVWQPPERVERFFPCAVLPITSMTMTVLPYCIQPTYFKHFDKSLAKKKDIPPLFFFFNILFPWRYMAAAANNQTVGKIKRQVVWITTTQSRYQIIERERIYEPQTTSSKSWQVLKNQRFDLFEKKKSWIRTLGRTITRLGLCGSRSYPAVEAEERKKKNSQCTLFFLSLCSVK